MKIGITGSSGFLGKHILTHLDSLGYETYIITREEFNSDNLTALYDFKPDYVIHCAWPTKTDLHSVEHMEFAEWTCHFFQLCKEHGIKVINLGSSSEYGVKEFRMEEFQICEPVNVYGIAKLSVTLYAKLLGFNTLRVFSPYGKGGSNFMSVYKDIEKFGNPNDRRDYFPVELLCQAVERLIHAQHIYGEIINVCSGESKTNSEVTGWHASGFGEKWNKYKQKQYEPRMWVGSNAKMKKLLNL